MATMSAGEWRMFWQARGMRELQLLLWAAREPLAAVPPGACDGYALRVASLLGSRASRDAIASEVGRIRRDQLELEPDPAEYACAADKISAWFEAAAS